MTSSTSVETDIPYTRTYRYYVTDMRDDTLIAELSLTDVSYSAKVSAAGEFSGSIPLAANNQGLDLFWATMPGRCAIHVMRGDQAVWGGPIWGRDYDAANQTISIQAGSWESYLFRRSIWHTLTYSNTVDQYDVVRDMITRMNNDFHGLTSTNDIVVPAEENSSVQIEVENRLSGKHQDTQVWIGSELRSFGTALTEFSNNLDGFEWNINVVWDPATQRFRRILVFRDTPPGQLKSGEAFTGERVGIDSNIFEYPGNIMSVSLSETADEAATRYFVVGGAPEGLEGAESFKPVGSWNNNEFLEDGWPILEVVESSRHSNVSKSLTLRGYARVYGQRAKPPVPSWSVTVNGDADPVTGSYEVGDWCRVIVNQDPFIAEKLLSNPTNNSLDSSLGGTVKRIMGYTVSVPTQPQFPETVTLELTDEWLSASGESGSSDGNTPEGQLPAAPQRLTGTSGDTLVTLDWVDNLAVDNVSSYNVYQGSTTPHLVETVTESTAEITGLTNGNSYTFTVKAVSTAGESPASNSVTLRPAAPVIVNPPNSAVRITAASADWETGHNRELIRNLCGFSDIIIVSQSKDFILNDYLPSGWVGYQNTGGRTKDNDPQHPAKAGNSIAIKQSKLDFVDQGLFLGVDNDDITARWVKWVSVRDRKGNTTRLLSLQYPAASYPASYRNTHTSAVVDFIESIPSTESFVIGGNVSMPHDDAAQAYNTSSYGDGVMLLGTKRGQVENFRSRTLEGSDQPVISITFTARDQ